MDRHALRRKLKDFNGIKMQAQEAEPIAVKAGNRSTIAEGLMLTLRDPETKKALAHTSAITLLEGKGDHRSGLEPNDVAVEEMLDRLQTEIDVDYALMEGLDHPTKRTRRAAANPYKIEEAAPAAAPQQAQQQQAPAQAQPQQQAAPSPLVKMGDANDNVKHLQGRLLELGYGPGAQDGNFGPLTHRALSRFQTEFGLKASGKVDNSTLDKLKSPGSPDPYKGDGKSNGKSNENGDAKAGVRAVAKDEKADGSDDKKDDKQPAGKRGKDGESSGGVALAPRPGSKGATRKLHAVLDALGYDVGKNGEKQESAVKKMQKRFGLETTGKVDAKTLKLVQRLVTKAHKSASSLTIAEALVPQDLPVIQSGHSARIEPPNLRDGEGWRECGTCVHFNGKNGCTLFNFPVDDDDLCDRHFSLSAELGLIPTDEPEPEAVDDEDIVMEAARSQVFSLVMLLEAAKENTAVAAEAGSAKLLVEARVQEMAARAAYRDFHLDEGIWNDFKHPRARGGKFAHNPDPAYSVGDHVYIHHADRQLGIPRGAGVNHRVGGMLVGNIRMGTVKKVDDSGDEPKYEVLTEHGVMLKLKHRQTKKLSKAGSVVNIHEGLYSEYKHRRIHGKFARKIGGLAAGQTAHLGHGIHVRKRTETNVYDVELAHAAPNKPTESLAAAGVDHAVAVAAHARAHKTLKNAPGPKKPIRQRAGGTMSGLRAQASLRHSAPQGEADLEEAKPDNVEEAAVGDCKLCKKKVVELVGKGLPREAARKAAEKQHDKHKVEEGIVRFNPTLHPRDHGKFSSKGGGGQRFPKRLVPTENSSPDGISIGVASPGSSKFATGRTSGAGTKHGGKGLKVGSMFEKRSDERPLDKPDTPDANVVDPSSPGIYKYHSNTELQGVRDMAVAKGDRDIITHVDRELARRRAEKVKRVNSPAMTKHSLGTTAAAVDPNNGRFGKKWTARPTVIPSGKSTPLYSTSPPRFSRGGS